MKTLMITVLLMTGAQAFAAELNCKAYYSKDRNQPIELLSEFEKKVPAENDPFSEHGEPLPLVKIDGLQVSFNASEYEKEVHLSIVEVYEDSDSSGTTTLTSTILNGREGVLYYKPLRSSEAIIIRCRF